MQVILQENQIAELLDKIAVAILDDMDDAEAGSGSGPALIGIRSRGEILAQRLQEVLSERLGHEVDCGTLDITLYRDDLNQGGGASQPTVRTTEIDFDLDNRLIVLVDDVLNTGRSVRAALNALADLGRPRAVRLAVLVDRGQRELPIRADYVGMETHVPRSQHVSVYLREVDDREEVVLE